jgi:hypothetical protein
MKGCCLGSKKVREKENKLFQDPMLFHSHSLHLFTSLFPFPFLIPRFSSFFTGVANQNPTPLSTGAREVHLMQDSWIPARQISFMGAICCEMNAAFGYCKVAEIVEIKGICFFVIFILRIKKFITKLS